MRRPIDSQRQKLYTSERAAFGPDAPQLTPRQAQALIDDVWRVFGGAHRRPAFRVSNRKGYGAAHYSSCRHDLCFGRQALQAWVILHEVAHAALWANGNGVLIAAHGPEFARQYLAIVERFAGFETRQRLGAAFRAHRVRVVGVSKPRGARPVRRRLIHLRVPAHPLGYGPNTTGQAAF